MRTIVIDGKRYNLVLEDTETTTTKATEANSSNNTNSISTTVIDDNIRIDANVKTTIKEVIIPLVYKKSYDLLLKVDDLIHDNEFEDIKSFSCPIKYAEFRGFEITRKEFDNLKKLVETFEKVHQDIEDIDSEKIKRKDVKRSTTKIKAIKRCYPIVLRFVDRY